jgi:thiol-disulfide isomerase/thioredoxin
MKQIVLLLGLVIAAGCTDAQKSANAKIAAAISSPVAPPQADTTHKVKPIAPYRIFTTDSVFVTPANLPKGKPVMIIYFSPDCSHCQRMMYELKPKMKELSHIQVVMITWSANYDIRAIREFKRDYGLKNYPNFTIGSEGYTRLVQNYYNVQTTPFIAMYDSKGKFFKYISKVPKTEDILAAAKKLN